MDEMDIGFKCPECGGTRYYSMVLFPGVVARLRCLDCGVEFRKIIPYGEWERYPAIKKGDKGNGKEE